MFWESGLIFILAYFLFWILLTIFGVIIVLKNLAHDWRQHHPHKGLR